MFTGTSGKKRKEKEKKEQEITEYGNEGKLALFNYSLNVSYAYLPRLMRRQNKAIVLYF